MAKRGAPIKAGYLSKRGGQWLPVRLLDLAVLLYAIHWAALDENIGHNDARESVQSLTKRLNRHVYVDPNVVESALYACNLLDEQGKFVHPQGIGFETMLKRVLGDRKFSRRYSTVERKEV